MTPEPRKKPKTEADAVADALLRLDRRLAGLEKRETVISRGALLPLSLVIAIVGLAITGTWLAASAKHRMDKIEARVDALETAKKKQ